MVDTAISRTDQLQTDQTDLRTGNGRRETHDREQNVGETERWISMLAGGGLVAFALARSRLSGLLSALAGAALVQRGLTGHCRMYDALGYDTAVEHHEFGVKARHGKKIVRSLHINRSREELYDFWRNLENLPQVMRHLESVTSHTDTKSRWIARGPFDARLEWDAEIKTDRRGEIIAWQSLPDSQVDTAGSVRFDKDASGQGTVLTVTLKYDPPGGRMVAELAHLLGQGLEEELDEDLREFKRTMESGEARSRVGHP
jgi:uncharacterized membrane protein